MDFHKDELDFLKKGYSIIGLDEVGRGALAGPVSAAACVIGEETYQAYLAKSDTLCIRDSKKTTKLQRTTAFEWIAGTFRETYVAMGAESINAMGIQKANLEALKVALLKALELVSSQKIAVFVDHFSIPADGAANQHIEVISKPRADSTYAVTASASICAKVQRDAEMAQLDKLFPDYGWEKNVGYGTLEHRQAILRKGLTPHHRELFTRKILLTAAQP